MTDHELAEDQGRSRRWPYIVLLGLGLVLVAGTLAVRAIEPDEPGTFYDPPGEVPGVPGAIIRSEELSDVPDGAVGWKILYASTDSSDTPIAVSGVVFAPTDDPPSGGRPIVAWAHPTTGVASRCAPSLRHDVASTVPGLSELLSKGYIITATDYPGLGTPGPHPYLVGESEARSVLDSIRAARTLSEPGASDRAVVWGHSQGGHAALWAAQIAGSYAPELALQGTSGAAPATDIAPLVRANEGTLTGNVLSSMALVAWSEVFPDAPIDEIIVPAARPIAETIAEGCIESEAQGLLLAPEAEVLRADFLSADPTSTQPWASLMADNSPSATGTVPYLITQGTADEVVQPDVTREWVATACDDGATVELRWYEGVDHTGIDEASADDVVAWVVQRFAGDAPQATCPPPEPPQG